MSTTDSQSPTACLTAIVGDELSCAKLGHLASQIRTEAAELGQYQFVVLAPGIARMSRTRRNKRRPSDLPPNGGQHHGALRFLPLNGLCLGGTTSPGHVDRICRPPREQRLT